MKNVLILTNHFIPSDVIASFRAKGYAFNFKKNGLYPIVVTRNILQHREAEYIIEKHELYEVHRLPTKQKSEPTKQNRWLEHTHVFIQSLFGYIDRSPENIATYDVFSHYLKDLLKRQKIDLTLSIFSPFCLIRLAYDIYTKNGIPYAVDFKDLWDNRYCNLNFTPTIKDKIYNFITRFYLKKWVSKSNLTIHTSAPWKDLTDKFLKFDTQKSIVIQNGYEKELFDSLPEKFNQKFTISHAGSIYNNQNLELIVDGLKKFLAKNPEGVKVEFIGGNVGHEKDTSVIGKRFRIKNYLTKELPTENFEFIDRINRIDLLNRLKKTDVLLFPTFPLAPGTYSGKIFEFLGLKKFILAAPNDDGVIDELIHETGAGASANTADDILQQLQQVFDLWKLKKPLYNGKQERITAYSREKQASVLAFHLKKNFFQASYE